MKRPQERKENRRGEPREPDPLWSVRNNGRHTECVLVGLGELGWEVRLLSDGGEFYARRWTLREEHAREILMKLDLTDHTCLGISR